MSILALLLLGCPADDTPTKNPPPDPVEGPLLVTGASWELGTAAYTDADGTWVYEGDDALDGLAIHVPEGTWADGASLVVSAAEVTSHGFGPNVEVLSPLITVDDGGAGYGDRLVDVLVPVPVPDGHFAMGFFYDEARNAVSGMALLELEDDAVQVGTSHFSSFFITSIREDLLEAEQTTSFEHGVDNWQHTNRGAFETPFGYCVGQSLSMWWWEARGPEVYGGDWKPLYGQFDNEAFEDWATPDFDLDDELGIRLSSFVQASLGFQEKPVQQQKLEDLQEHELPDVYTLNAFAFAMYMTGEPQLVAMTGPGGGHAILAIGKDALDPDQRIEAPSLPAGTWYCPLENFDADDGCDCGCGVVDPDCEGAEAELCDSCNLPGSCNTIDGCPGDLNEGYNAVCGAVPEPPEPPSGLWITGPGVLRVSDPNTPKPDADRTMVFDYDTGRFETFYSGASAASMGTPYDELLYMGNDTMLNPAVVQEAWGFALQDQLRWVTPSFDLEVQAPGGGWAPLVNGMTIAGDEMRVRVAEPQPAFKALLHAYNEDLHRIHLNLGLLDEQVVPLRSGEQTVGIQVYGHTRGGYSWVDFEWFDLVSEDAPDGPMLERTLLFDHAVGDLSIEGDYAYVVNGEGELVVVNLVDGSVSVAVDLSGHSYGRGIDARPDLLAMTAGSFQLAMLPSPGVPVLAEGWGFNSDLRRVKLGGDHAFAVGKLTYTDSGAFAVAATWDPTDDTVQRGRSLLHLGEALIDVELSEDGTLAFASGSAGELFVIDISHPDAPLDIATTPTTSWGNGGGVFVDGEGLVWTANPGLRAFDVTVPTAPVLLNPSAYDGYDTDSRDVVVVGTTALLVGVGYDWAGWLASFDVGDPTDPVFEHRLELDGSPTDIEVVDRRAYVGLVREDGKGGIAVIAF